MDSSLPCSLPGTWSIFPLPVKSLNFPKRNHFSITALSAANLLHRHFGFLRSPGNESSLLAFLLAFTDFSSLPPYNLRCCWSTDSFTLHREKESEPTIIYSNGHRCQDRLVWEQITLTILLPLSYSFASAGPETPLLLVLPTAHSFASPRPETSLLLVLPTAHSFASPGPEKSLLLVLPMAHSFALALPIQLPQIKIVWAIDLSAKIDVIGIYAYNTRPRMSYTSLFFRCHLQIP